MHDRNSWIWTERMGGGWDIAYRSYDGDETPWLAVQESEVLHSLGLKGWGLYAAKRFEKQDVITVYVGEDVGQEGSEEAKACLAQLIAADKGRHIMQINRRIKGRRDNMRLINGENGFTGAQYANTARGTRLKNNAVFGSTGTFTAKETIVNRMWCRNSN